MLIRRETPADVPAIRAVTAAAFAPESSPEAAEAVGAATPPVEAALVDALRADPGWLPALSMVAVLPVDGSGDTRVVGHVVGHVVASRGRVGTAAVLGLGPLSVHPGHQGRGIGSALVHALLGAADALDEPLVALLGSPRYYPRFGFRPAADHGIQPPVPEWEPHFQVRVLTAYDPAVRGTFRYAEPFEKL